MVSGRKLYELVIKFARKLAIGPGKVRNYAYSQKEQ